MWEGERETHLPVCQNVVETGVETLDDVSYLLDRSVPRFRTPQQKARLDDTFDRHRHLFCPAFS